MASYPMWRLKFARDEARMRARWPAARREGWTGEMDAVLRHVSDHGPTSSLDVGTDEPKGSSGWWDWHPSKTALEFLWRSGRLAVCRLRGDRPIGSLDAEGGSLAVHVRAFWPKPGVRAGKGLLAGLEAELNRVGALAVTQETTFEKGWMQGVMRMLVIPNPSPRGPFRVN